MIPKACRLFGIMRQNTSVGQTVESMTRNGWVYLALLSPYSPTIWLYQPGESGRGSFREYNPRAEHPPVAATSLDWYRGWRDFLEFAEIGEAPDDPSVRPDNPALRPPPLARAR